MNPTLGTAEQLASAGRYRQALESLSTSAKRDHKSADVLRAELLELTGQCFEARTIIQTLLQARDLPDAERSRAEFVLSRIDAEAGDFDAELKHLQRSILCAERARDLRGVCAGQLRLLAMIADRSGLDSVGALMTELRNNVTKLGEPNTTAALHLFVAELDGKRGLLVSAVKHTELAKRLLGTAPHLWLEAWAHNNLLAISILQYDFDSALRHGSRALSTSTECGATASLRRCLGNLGRLHLTLGNFEEALEYLEKALRYSTASNEQVNGTLESMARVYLAQGRMDECLTLVGRIEASTQPPNGTGRYVHRYSMLTKAELLIRLGRTDEGGACLLAVADLARQASDGVLLATADLLKFELEHAGGPRGGRQGGQAGALPPISELSPDVHGLYERAEACSLAWSGMVSQGRHHFERAARVYRGFKNVPGLIELNRSWAHAAERGRSLKQVEHDSSSLSGGRVIQNVAALMLHAGQPELLATGLVAVLADLESVHGAVAVARDAAGQEEVLASLGAPPSGSDVRTLTLGTTRQRTIEVRLQPLADIESQASLNAVSMLLGIVANLEQARAEREERLTLWPVDDLPSDDDDSVILGKMQQAMAQARRLAPTKAIVLITGESGTGKELLARAVHGFSPRARKPFIPFNCAAVPRELLESQMFGHRRGAFTGADRDSGGVIRAAKDGTLFLDEIGELALELQPKLLRFLESGEISPLGEPYPLFVDVRIVAATNADLEQLMLQGRFREDLFYRLNVLRINIPPLRDRRDEIPALAHHFVAKACTEFGKGRVRIAEETMERLLLYPWPGNVRQLSSELRQMVARADADAVLVPALLSRLIRQETDPTTRGHSGADLSLSLSEKLAPTLAKVEGAMIKAALHTHQGRLEATARALGISRKGLYLKRLRLGV